MIKLLILYGKYLHLVIYSYRHNILVVSITLFIHIYK